MQHPPFFFHKSSCPQYTSLALSVLLFYERLSSTANELALSVNGRTSLGVRLTASVMMEAPILNPITGPNTAMEYRAGNTALVSCERPTVYSSFWSVGT